MLTCMVLLQILGVAVFLVSVVLLWRLPLLLNPSCLSRWGPGHVHAQAVLCPGPLLISTALLFVRR